MGLTPFYQNDNTAQIHFSKIKGFVNDKNMDMK